MWFCCSFYHLIPFHFKFDFHVKVRSCSRLITIGTRIAHSKVTVKCFSIQYWYNFLPFYDGHKYVYSYLFRNSTTFHVWDGECNFNCFQFVMPIDKEVDAFRKWVIRKLQFTNLIKIESQLWKALQTNMIRDPFCSEKKILRQIIKCKTGDFQRCQKIIICSLKYSERWTHLYYLKPVTRYTRYTHRIWFARCSLFLLSPAARRLIMCVFGWTHNSNLDSDHTNWAFIFNIILIFFVWL